MLRGLQEFLAGLAAPANPSDPPRPSVELATAVLLVEVMRADAGSDPAEAREILDLLHRRFQLDDDELKRLLEAAEARSRAANDFFAFTSLLNEQLEQPQKVAVVEHMWQVAYADGDADAGEHHVISKVAGLLHVTHGEYIAAKLRARDAARQGPAG